MILFVCLVGWLVVLVVCGGVAGLAILLIGTVWHCIIKRGHKKKHNFGVKKLRNTVRYRLLIYSEFKLIKLLGGHVWLRQDMNGLDTTWTADS